VTCKPGIDAITRLSTRATSAHQDGNLSDAKNIYLQILAIDPGHAPSLYGLGLTAFQAGNFEAAAAMFRRASSADPGNSVYRKGLGAALHRQQRFDEALMELREAVALNPQDEDACFMLGNLLVDLRRVSEAKVAFEQALRLRQDFPEAHNNLAVVLGDEGKLEEAEEHCRSAIRLKPDYAEAYTNLGNILCSRDRLDEGKVLFERAIELQPNRSDAHINLGNVFRKQMKFAEAVSSYERALALTPQSAEGHNNLGGVLEDQDLLDDAVCHLARAIELRADYADAYNNLGNVLRRRKQYELARKSYDRGLTFDPNHTEILWNRSLLDLQLGDFDNGFRGYEVRHRRRTNRPRSFPEPLWHGQVLNGARILLHSEQGLGDAIQFLRYVPLVRAAGGRVILAIPRALQRLALQMPEIDDLKVTGESLPQFDLHCPLMSLPLAFRTTVESIPAEVPYMRVPPEALNHADAIDWVGGMLRVGLVWSGNPEHCENKRRSIPLKCLSPLFQVRGVRFYSLQIGEPGSGIVDFPMIDLQPSIRDLADTAAIMNHLDLVITVDTAVAHLAGALARPTWVLLAYAADWRWLTDRQDSPWYRTVRLFRQTSLGNWDSVVEQVQDALTTVATQRLRIE
jgi:tetratricopeptide (TPR) repeat protein